MGSSGMYHRPLLWSRKPVMMTWLCFNMFTSNLVKIVKMVMFSSLQNCTMKMWEPVVMSLKTCTDCA